MSRDLSLAEAHQLLAAVVVLEVLEAMLFAVVLSAVIVASRPQLVVAHAELVELDRLQDDLVMKLFGVDRSTFDQVLGACLVPLLAALVEVSLAIHLKLACRPREYAVLPLVLEYIWLEPESLTLLLIVAQGILRVH